MPVIFLFVVFYIVSTTGFRSVRCISSRLPQLYTSERPGESTWTKSANSDQIIEKLIKYCDSSPYGSNKTSIESLIDRLIGDYKVAEFKWGGNVTGSEIDGIWQLRYTTELVLNDHRGPAKTYMSINSTDGSINSRITFPYTNGSISSLNFLMTATLLQRPTFTLEHQRLIIERKSHILRTINIRIPFIKQVNKLLGRTVYNRLSPRKSFEVLYLDDDLLIQQNLNGSKFVLVKQYLSWDPMIGWTYISAL